MAALSLALSPVNIAVDRSNNTESCLILLLLIAVWLGMRAPNRPAPALGPAAPCCSDERSDRLAGSSI